VSLAAAIDLIRFFQIVFVQLPLTSFAPILFGLAFAVIRIMNDLLLDSCVVLGFGLVLLLTRLAPKSFVPIAFDSGAVATGPVAVNFVLPITTGMAINLMGEEAGVLGYGVVGIIAMVPITCMLIRGRNVCWCWSRAASRTPSSTRACGTARSLGQVRRSPVPRVAGIVLPAATP